MPTSDGTASRSTIAIHDEPARWLDVPAVVRDKARQHGDKHFCEMDGRALTYAELDRLSDAVAVGLPRRGVGKGDFVASFVFNFTSRPWAGSQPTNWELSGHHSMPVSVATTSLTP